MLGPRTVAYYTERSRHFLARVDGELDVGDVEVACEMLWGAAAQAVKAVAQRSGWAHDTHRLVAIAVERLIAEGRAPPHLAGQYKMASDFHQGFYGDRIFSADQVRRAKEPIAQFMDALRRLA